MATNIGTIEATLRLNDQFSSRMAAAGASLQAAGQKIERTGQRISTMGGTLTRSVSAPLLAITAVAAKFSSDFSESMVKIESLVGVARDEVAGFKKEIFELSKASGKGPQELADAMFYITSAGLRGAQAVDALRASAQGAAIGLGDTATIADAATSAMNAYGAENLNAAQAVNTLALAVREGKLEAASLAPVLGRLLPTAASLGVSFQDVAGALAVMSRTGLNAAEASTSLNAIFTLLAKGGSKQAKEVLKAMGLSMAQLRDVVSQPGGVVEALRLLATASEKLGDEALQGVVENVRALRGVLTILQQKASTVDEVMRKVADGADILGIGVERLNEEFGFKFAQALSTARVEFIKLGDEMAPVINDLIAGLSGLIRQFGELVKWYAKLSPGSKELVNRFVLFGTVIGPLTFALGGLIQTFGILVIAGGKLATGMALVAKAFATWKAVGTSFLVDYYVGVGRVGKAVNTLLGPLGAVLSAVLITSEMLRRSAANMSMDIQDIVKDVAEKGAAMEALLKSKKLGLAGFSQILTEEDLSAIKSRMDTLVETMKRAKENIDKSNPETDRVWIELQQKIISGAVQELEQLGAAYIDSANAAKEAANGANAAGAATDGAGNAVRGLTEEQQQLKKAISDQLTVIELTRAAVAKYGTDQERLNAVSQVYGALLEQNLPTTGAFADEMIALAVAAADAQTQLSDITNGLKADASAFETLTIKARDFNAELLKLAKMGQISLGFDTQAARDAANAWAEHTNAIKVAQDKVKAVVEYMDRYGVGIDEAAAALKLSAEEAALLGIELGKSADESEKLAEQMQENFIRGVQSAISGFITDILSGTGNALENFGEALKKMLISVVAEYLSKLLLAQLTAHIDAMKKITAEGIARKVAAKQGSGGGVSMSGTPDASMMSTGGSSGALWAVAAMAAVIAIAKWSNDQNSKKIYGTTAGGNVQGGQFTGSWTGKLDQTGPQVWNAFKGLVEAIQQGTGALLSGINQAQIKIRNDKKFFEAVVNNEVIGRFRTAEEAIVAAAKAMFTKGDLSRELAPEIKQVLQNFRGGSVEELAKAIATVQGIIDKISGLTDIEIQLRELPAKAAQLTAQLREMGVSMDNAAALSQKWRVNELNAIRDQITGHQRTAAEEMAIRQRQAAMFNAEVTLMRAELEEKKAALEAKKALLQGDRGIFFAQAEMAKANLGQRAEIARREADLYSAQSGMGRSFLEGQGEFTKFLGGMYGTELSIRQQYAEYSQDILDTMISNLNASIDAIDAALANMPELIDPKEIKLGGGGGGGAAASGGPSGPSRGELRDQLLAELEQVARSLEGELMQALLNLDDWLADMTQRAIALGIPLDQINQLYARQREELIARAQAEVQQYTANPLMTQLDQIRAWAEQMREVYEALGLSLEEVNEAEQQRINDLLDEAYAILGIPGADIVAKYEQMADALEFLREALESGTISAEDYAAAIEQAGMAAYASMIDTLLQYVDNEDARRQLEQIRYDLAIAQLMLEFELLQSLNLLTEEQIALIQGLIDALPDAPPIDLGGGSSGGYYGGGGSDYQSDSMDRLTRAIERLTEYYESLIQDTSVSPLSLADRFAAAQQEYQQLQSDIAYYSSWQHYDEDMLAELYEQLPDVAQQYLELAAQMFGTATAGYQEIFQDVLEYIEGILGQYEEPDAWSWLQGDMNYVRDRLYNIEDFGGGSYDRLGEIVSLLNPAEGGAAPSGAVAEMSGVSSAYVTGTARMQTEMLASAIKDGSGMTVDAIYDTQESTARELQRIRVELKARDSASDRRAQALRRSAA